jgi:hypothetical protein
MEFQQELVLEKMKIQSNERIKAAEIESRQTEKLMELAGRMRLCQGMSFCKQ